MKKNLIKSLFLIGSICINSNLCIFSNVSCAKINEVHICNINDIHGAAAGYGDTNLSTSSNIPGVIRLTRDVHQTINKYPGSLFLSAGDNNSGNAFSSCMHGENFFPILKSMGINYSAIGNHEFDWESTENRYLVGKIYDNLARTSQTKGNYFIASNILNNNDDVNYYDKSWNIDEESKEFINDFNVWNQQHIGWADPYKIVDLNGLKVCIFGLTTQLTKTDGNGNVTKNFTFMDYNPAIVYANYLCKIKEQKEYSNIDSFIILSHIASDMDEDGNVTNEAANLAKDISLPVDLIISGHSHKKVCGSVYNNKNKKNILIGQARSESMAFLDTTFIYDNNLPSGHKLKNIKMQVKDVGIDFQNHDPKSDNKQERDLAIECAQHELTNIIANSNHNNNYLQATINQYIESKQKVLDILSDSVIKNDQEFELTYSPIENAIIGHEYYCSKSIVEVIGAWIMKGVICGTNMIDQEQKNGIKPTSISFCCSDSIRNKIVNTNKITWFDLYQLLPYDNNVIKATVTVGQLWNIVNYLLSGGWINNNKPDNNSIFVYGTSGEEYDKVTEMENDPITKKNTPLPSINVDDKTTTKLKFLCGPLQFYGLKFAVNELDENKKITVNGKHLRQYELKHENEIPLMWIFDPNEPTCDINDPDTWKKVTKDNSGWNIDRLVPITIDSFMLNGGNYQNTMFNVYFNDNNNVGNGFIYNYPNTNDYFLRDIVAKYYSSSACNLRTIDQNTIDKLIIK